MATLNLSLGMKYVDGEVEINPPDTWQEEITISGSNPLHNIQSVGTSAEALVVGDTDVQASGGYMWVRNLDGANFVEIGDFNDPDLTPFVKVGPGQTQFFGITGGLTALGAQADTAAVNIEYFLFPA